MQDHTLIHRCRLELAYGDTPSACPEPKLAVVGAGLGLDFASQVCDLVERVDGSIKSGDVIVFDAGPLDVLHHLGNAALPRINLMELGLERVGGKTVLWGMASPRPPTERLHEWPYSAAELSQRFDRFEAEMGVPDPIPMSHRHLEQRLSDSLAGFAKGRAVEVRSAPLAINAAGHRWSAMDRFADLLDRGVAVVPQARCTRLELSGRRVVGVHGTCRGQPFICRPQFVALAAGVENTLPLLDEILPNREWRPADHFRIDLQGWLPAEYFGSYAMEDLGVAVLYLGCRSDDSAVPFHLEVKVAPKPLWARYMPSGDNLRTSRDDGRLLVQVQAIAQMHESLPTSSLVRDRHRIKPDISLLDYRFKQEIGVLMAKVAAAIGVENPQIRDRPLLQNHHLYGLLRVGRGLTPELVLEGTQNCVVLAPTAYPALDDDANPMLKSRVLNSYAAQFVARNEWPTRPAVACDCPKSECATGTP